MTIKHSLICHYNIMILFQKRILAGFAIRIYESYEFCLHQHFSDPYPVPLVHSLHSIWWTADPQESLHHLVSAGGAEADYSQIHEFGRHFHDGRKSGHNKVAGTRITHTLSVHCQNFFLVETIGAG